MANITIMFFPFGLVYGIRNHAGTLDQGNLNRESCPKYVASFEQPFVTCLKTPIGPTA